MNLLFNELEEKMNKAINEKKYVLMYKIGNGISIRNTFIPEEFRITDIIFFASDTFEFKIKKKLISSIHYDEVDNTYKLIAGETKYYFCF